MIHCMLLNSKPNEKDKLLIAILNYFYIGTIQCNVHVCTFTNKTNIFLPVKPELQTHSLVVLSQ